MHCASPFHESEMISAEYLLNIEGKKNLNFRFAKSFLISEQSVNPMYPQLRSRNTRWEYLPKVPTIPNGKSFTKGDPLSTIRKLAVRREFCKGQVDNG